MWYLVAVLGAAIGVLAIATRTLSESVRIERLKLYRAMSKLGEVEVYMTPLALPENGTSIEYSRGYGHGISRVRQLIRVVRAEYQGQQ